MLTEKAKKAVREIAVAGCFVLAFSCAVEAYPPSEASFAKQSGYSGAIPSAEECKTARAKLAELTADDYKALKAKTKTNEQVGDALAQYADNEESAAGKFALLQDAFQQYVLGKSVDKAESVYSKALTVGGMEYALEMARPSRSRLSAYATSKNAPAKALKERIMADEKSFQRVGIVKAKLKKAPGDESLCEQLGIEYAAIGDWESALAAFVTASGEVAKVADWELNGGKGVDYTAATVGAFWWKFADNFPKRKNVEEAMKLHAAMWYRQALNKDVFKGNEKVVIERRIAAAEECENVFSYALPDSNMYGEVRVDDAIIGTDPQLVWKNASLTSVKCFAAKMVSNVAGSPLVWGALTRTNANSRIVQFQYDDDEMLKCTVVKFVQKKSDVYAHKILSGYVKGQKIGYDFEKMPCTSYEYDVAFVNGLVDRPTMRSPHRLSLLQSCSTAEGAVGETAGNIVWRELNLSSFNRFEGQFLVAVQGDPTAKSYTIKEVLDGKFVQFQLHDGEHIKTICVHFFQNGNNVCATILYRGYCKGVPLGTDFDHIRFSSYGYKLGKLRGFPEDGLKKTNLR